MVTKILSDNDFKKLVAQAKLLLTPEEVAKIKSQIDEALVAVQVLEELDTKNVLTLNHPTGNLFNITRDDEVVASLPQELALSGAHQTHNGYFVTKAVFDETN